MQRYFLLRNNQESGPYTVRELKEKTLLTTDLVWEEGVSTAWHFPVEIEALRHFAKSPEKPALKKQQVNTNSTPVIAFASTSTRTEQSDDADNTTGTEQMPTEPQTPSFEALKSKYAERTVKRPVWKPVVAFAPNLFGLTVLVIGVMLAAFMVKKAVDNIELQPIDATADALYIESEVLPSSSTAHAAHESLVQAGDKTPTDSVKASSAALLLIAEKKKVPGTEKPTVLSQSTGTDNDATEPMTSQNSAGEGGGIAHASLVEKKQETEDLSFGNTEGSSHDEKLEKEVKKSTKPDLQLSANKYDVGFLGGISNLQLYVTNPSQKKISKATVVVDYLKPNGKVVSTQTTEVSGIAPGASKTIDLPDNSRGVSVRFRVTAIED